jgi:hypothetical protein
MTLFAVVEKLDEFAERFAGWVLKRMVETTIEMLFRLML